MCLKYVDYTFILPYSVIGFSQKSILIVEAQETLEHIHVRFYSGANERLLKGFDVQFGVQVCGGGSATQGMLVSSTRTYSIYD